MKNKNEFVKKRFAMLLSVIFVFSFSINAFAKDTEIDKENDGGLAETPINELEYLKQKSTIQKKISYDVRTDINKNINELNEENELNVSTLQAKTINSDGVYTSVQDYLTYEGQYKHVYPIPVGPGQLLHIQLDLPHSAELDYDLELYEVDPTDLSLTLVDLSQLSTYMNGVEGTASENVGVYNTSGETKEYAVYVVSYMGASINQPFTLHFGINSGADSFEADENINWAVGATLEPMGPTVINMRSMDTLVDSDWYEFTIPTSKNYDVLNIDLDNASKTAGYKVELYRLISNQLRKVDIETTGKAAISSGKYYVRVTAIESTSLTGSNYSLSILPDFQASEVKITSYGGGTNNVNYGMGTFYRINGGANLTVNGWAKYEGQPLPNASITVTVINDHWEPAHLRYRTVTTTTDSAGNFTVSVPTSNSTAAYTYSNSGPYSYTHYFDYGYVQILSGTAAHVNGIYFFAYSI